jgi:hypothetical protein
MTFKGTGQLAMLADALPTKARVCLGILVAEIALVHLRRSPDLGLARTPLNFALDWHRGESVDFDRLEETIELEESSLLFAEARARHRHCEKESLAWVLFGGAIAYVVYVAAQATGHVLWTSLNSIDESVLDDVERSLRELEPSAMELMARAAAFLRQYPDAPVAQLEALMTKR